MTTNSDRGAKFDQGKEGAYRGTLGSFPRALEAVTKVATFGASKYSWFNWKGVPDAYWRYQDAKMRHANAHAKGELVDTESGQYHLAHEAWNALAVLELFLEEQQKSQ